MPFSECIPHGRAVSLYFAMAGEGKAVSPESIILKPPPVKQWQWQVPGLPCTLSWLTLSVLAYLIECACGNTACARWLLVGIEPHKRGSSLCSTVPRSITGRFPFTREHPLSMQVLKMHQMSYRLPRSLQSSSALVLIPLMRAPDPENGRAMACLGLMNSAWRCWCVLSVYTSLVVRPSLSP